MPKLKPTVDRAEHEYSYAVNVRLTQRHADFLNALKRDEGLRTSEAVREAIDRAIAAKRGEGPMDVTTGQVLELRFTAVPELDHIEVLERTGNAEGDEEHRLWSVDLHLAEQLLEQLSAAVEALRS